MNWSDIEIWKLLAGLGLFLFGIFLVEESIKTLVARPFKKFLRHQTDNPIKAVLAGILVTIVLQSSSMVSLLVMSFVGAGVLGLRNGIGIIMGANVGTTATGWLVSLIGFKLDITAFVMPILAVGGISHGFFKSEKWLSMSKLLLGFGFLFLGLSFMKDGFMEFAEKMDFSFLLDKPMILFVFIGFVLSAMLHSSAAAMVIFLSSLAAGLITLRHGFFLVLGSELGTTMTAVFGTLNGNMVRKKVGWSHFLFNSVGVIVGFFLVDAYAYIIAQWMGLQDPIVSLVMFQTLVNVTGIILLLPLINQFTWLVDKIIVTKEDKNAKFLRFAEPQEMGSSLEALEKECLVFLRHAIEVNGLLFKYPKPMNGDFIHAYYELKTYEAEISDFYIKMQLSAPDTNDLQEINRFAASIRNATLSAKYLKDSKPDLDELSNSAADSFYDLYRMINGHIHQFYREIEVLIEHYDQLKPEEIARIGELQKQYYQEWGQYLIQLFSTPKETEMNMPTLQNLLREVSNSNESLLRMLNYLIR